MTSNETRETAVSELKPCPFCGGPAKLSEHKTEPCVYCSACNFTMGAGNTPAVERWNRRSALAAPAVEKVAQVGGKCETCDGTRVVGEKTDEIIPCPVTGRPVGVTKISDCPDCVIGVARGDGARPATTTRPDEPASRTGQQPRPADAEGLCPTCELPFNSRVSVHAYVCECEPVTATHPAQSDEVRDDWQPIDTAPRDWLVIVRGENGFYDLAFFNGIYWHDQSQRSLRFVPHTWHWIPDAMRPPANSLAERAGQA
jgi:restriction alleviation protein Lar